MTTSFDEYFENVGLEQLFKKLGAANSETLAKAVQHFTVKEAEKRDKIVLGYFGEEGVNRIVEAVTEKLLSAPSLRKGSNVLDVGAGSGFFTTKIAKKINNKIPNVKFYAMDATPAMPMSLAKKEQHIIPFLGIAENIEASAKEAATYVAIPEKFDAAISTLMLHHSAKPEKVFESISKVLTDNGKAVILDLCKHKFAEFKTEMEDVHLGFKPEDIRKKTAKYFSKVTIEKMPGIGCTCSGRSAEIFVATMQKQGLNTVV